MSLALGFYGYRMCEVFVGIILWKGLAWKGEREEERGGDGEGKGAGLDGDINDVNRGKRLWRGEVEGLDIGYFWKRVDGRELGGEGDGKRKQ